jgi:hypothetical protein
MSLVTMTSMASKRMSPEVATETSKPAQSTDVPDALKVVAAYVPSEVLAIYVSAVGMFYPSNPSTKWILFTLASVLIPVIIAISAAAGKTNTTPSRVTPMMQAKLAALGMLAFAAWAAAMPDGPFVVMGSEATKVGAVAVLVLAALLPGLAKILGVG